MTIRFSLLIFPVFFTLACCKGQSCCENAYTMFINTGSTMNLDSSCLAKEEREAAAIGQAALERRAKCLLMLSYDDLNSNRFENALQRLEVLKSFLSPSDAAHKQYTADLYNLLAYIYNQQSYQSLAEASYKEAITLYKELGMRDGQLINEANLVKLLAEQGKFSEAIDLGTRVCEETKSLFSFFRSGELKGTAANNLAFAYSLQSQSYRADMRTIEMRSSAEKALEIFKKNVDIASGIGGAPYRVTLLNASNAAALAEQYDVSRNFIQQYFDGPGKYPHVLNCANFSSSAVLHARTGSFDEALSDLINSCRPLGLATSDDPLATPEVNLPSGDTIQLFIAILQNKGAVLHLHYNKHHQIEYLEKSLAAYEQAAKILNNLQNEIFDEASVIAQRLRFHSVYPNAARIAALLHQETPTSELKKKDEYWRKAFKYAEQGQGFVLRQNVRAAFEAECNEYSTAEPHCREKALRDKLFQFRKLGAQDSILATLDEYYKFFHALKTSSNPADVQHYNQRFNHDVPSLEDVQQSLLPDHRAVFIEYVWSAPQPFALWITKKSKGVVLLDIPSGDKFWEDAKRYQEDWLKGEKDIGPSQRKISNGLYKVLLGNVLNDIPAVERRSLERIVISGDNGLRTIAFEALLMDEVPAKGNSHQYDLNYVLKEYIVSYQYSAALWRLQKEQLLSLEKSKRSRIGSFINIDQTGCGTLQIDNLGQFSLKKLPTLSSQVISFNSATTEVFEKNAPSFDLLHFCMHGCLNADPELSYLSFKGNAMRVLDLYSIRLNARLAVFASCSTAKQLEGEHESGIKGEGVIGLHRAVSYAGCPNVIATLNEVRDKPSALLLEYFYDNLLKDKMPTDEALAKAKRDYLKYGKESRHPLFWANFICVGPPAQFAR